MKNQSEFTLYETDDKGVTHTIAPGEDVPSWVKVDNPYVTGKAEGDEEERPAPRRGRPAKGADES